MVLPELDAVESAISQLSATLKVMDSVYPTSSELVVQAIHDRCKDPETGRFRLPEPHDCTEIAREQIALAKSGQTKLAHVDRRVFGISLLFL